MAVEKLGGGKSLGAQNGPQSGNHLGGREEAQEETPHRLHVFQSKAPQLLGISIFLL